MNTYYVYIVASKSGVLYVGVTNDLERRVGEHRARQIPGFSAKYNCDRLVWFEAFANVNEAIETEKRIKGWRRDKKIALIAEKNPALADLTIVHGPRQLDSEVPRVATAPLGMTWVGPRRAADMLGPYGPKTGAPAAGRLGTVGGASRGTDAGKRG